MRAPALVFPGFLLLAMTTLPAQDSSQGPSSHADSRSPSVTHQQRNPQNLGVSLSGIVQFEDGRPPAEPVQVELFCNGRIRRQTLTSPDGSFSLEVGSPRSQDWLDPSVGGSYDGSISSLGTLAPTSEGGDIDEIPGAGRGRVDLTGCEVRASPRSGFSSTSIRLRSRSVFDKPDLGTLLIRKLSSSAATTVSLNTLMAPPSARKEYEEALEKLQEGEPDLEEIAKLLEKALKEFEAFSAAWDLLGRLQAGRQDYSSARESFLTAAEHEPGFIQPYLGLGQLAIRQSDWTELLQWSSAVLDLDSRYPLGLYWHGLANYHLSNFSAVESSLSALYEEKEKINAYPFGLLLLGVVHANQGKIKAAGRELELYMKLMPEDQVSDEQRKQLTRQLALWRQQGLITKADQADK